MSSNQDLKPTRQLMGIIKIEFQIEVVTGLLIRMPVAAQVYRIGGADTYPMVTLKKYNEQEYEVPYIPGSSLKGRMRSLLELAMNKKLYSTDGRIWIHARYYGTRPHNMNIEELIKDIKERCVIDEIFGSPAIQIDDLKKSLEKRNQGLNEDEASKTIAEIQSLLAPTRLLVDDIYPDLDYVKRLSDNFTKTISIAEFLEEKSENAIDRVTAAANPRTIVRVKPGTIFSGSMKLLVFDIDATREYIGRNLSVIVNGLKLIENTYLGGSGSRGYGRVSFKKIRIKLLNLVKDFKETSIGEYRDLEELEERIDDIIGKIEKELTEKQ